MPGADALERWLRGVADLLLAAGCILVGAGLTAVIGHVVNSAGPGWDYRWHSDALTIGLGVVLVVVCRAGKRIGAANYCADG